MKIAIDALGISRPGGGRSATLNLLEPLFDLDRDNEYIVFLDGPEASVGDRGENVRQVIAPVAQRFAVRAWAQAIWPLLLRREKVQVIHHTKNLSTLFSPCASLVTIYDMTILLHPEMFPTLDVLYWRHVQPYVLRAADRIIAISHQTAKDLVEFYGLPSENIRVICPAYDPRFRVLPPGEAERVRHVYGTGARFILHVGSLSRKKNLLTLLKAYEQLCERGYDGKLVLVGRQYGKGYDRAFFAGLEASSYRSRVVLTGPAPDKDLPGLYNAAELMIFPSLHEGFGIVALEAMACGTPVITSNTGALPEVVGEGATILEDPLDERALADSAELLLTDESRHAQQISRGLKWVTRYSTVEAARQTLAVYDELLG